jgi:hypothetical protein
MYIDFKLTKENIAKKFNVKQEIAKISFPRDWVQIKTKNDCCKHIIIGQDFNKDNVFKVQISDPKNKKEIINFFKNIFNAEESEIEKINKKINGSKLKTVKFNFIGDLKKLNITPRLYLNNKISTKKPTLSKKEARGKSKKLPDFNDK